MQTKLTEKAETGEKRLCVGRIKDNALIKQDATRYTFKDDAKVVLDAGSAHAEEIEVYDIQSYHGQTVIVLKEDLTFEHPVDATITTRAKPKVSFSQTSGMRQGGSAIQISPEADVSLLVAFEEDAGRLYSGVLLRAPEAFPHRYGRELEEVVLSQPNDRTALPEPNSPASRGARSPSARSSTHLSRGAQSPGAGRASPPLEMDKIGKENAMQETAWTYLLLYTVKEGILLFFSQDFAECEEVVREVAMGMGLGHKPVEHLQGAVDETAVRAVAEEMRTLKDGLKGQGFKGKQLNEHPEVVALSEKLHVAKGGTPVEGPQGHARYSSKAMPGDANSLKVKCVEHRVGRAPAATTKLLTELIVNDLFRRFSVFADAEDQPECTNCVVFSLRAMMAMQLAVRGYDIQTVCERQEWSNSLGHKAGEAACHAWEQMWRRVRP